MEPIGYHTTIGPARVGSCTVIGPEARQLLPGSISFAVRLREEIGREARAELCRALRGG